MQTRSSTKTWFITGTSSGFGRMLTEQLLARGDRVAATLRKTHALDDMKAHSGDRLWVASLDVTDAGAVRQVVDRAFDELGHIDVVVNNAGYGLLGAAEELTDDQIRHQIDTNVIGSIQVIRAALPHLRAQGGGRLLQVSSEGGQIAYPHFSLYHTSKWAIEGFVEAVAQETAGNTPFARRRCPKQTHAVPAVPSRRPCICTSHRAREMCRYQSGHRLLQIAFPQSRLQQLLCFRTPNEDCAEGSAHRTARGA